MKTNVNLFDDLNWENAIEYPDGTKQKVLRDETGAKTVLLKLPAGFFMAQHSHLTTEQHFVLDGEYSNAGELFTSGTYQIYKNEEMHGPFESEKGALILVIWDPYK